MQRWKLGFKETPILQEREDNLLRLPFPAYIRYERETQRYSIWKKYISKRTREQDGSGWSIAEEVLLPIHHYTNG